MPTARKLSPGCRLFLLLLILGCFLGCASLEPELKKLMGDPSRVVVIKDESNVYWAFAGQRIQEVKSNTVTLKEGTVVAKGTGTAPAEEIAKTLIDLRSRANPGGFGAVKTTVRGDSGEITAEIAVLAEATAIRVTKIVLSQ